MSSAVRDSVTPTFSRRLSSLRSLLSPPRLVCAISARTTTPRPTAVGQRLLDRIEVESENDDVDGLLGAVDGLDDRRDAVVGLRDQLHVTVYSGASGR